MKNHIQEIQQTAVYKRNYSIFTLLISILICISNIIYAQQYGTTSVDGINLNGFIPTEILIPNGLGDSIPCHIILDNQVAARTISTNKLFPNNGLNNYSLTGEGILVLVWDGGGVHAEHPELVDRITFGDQPSDAVHWHATHVAGTIIASGEDTKAQGMATDARILSYDFWNNIAEMRAEALKGRILSNHSYGVGTGWEYNSSADVWLWAGNPAIDQKEDYKFGLYTAESAAADDIAYNSPLFTMVFSAGNHLDDDGPEPGEAYNMYEGGELISSTEPRNTDGGSNGLGCISYFAVAKNALVVGAVEDLAMGYTGEGDVNLAYFSSTGPTDDGRIKPDFVANGVSLYSSLSDEDATGNLVTTYGRLSGTSMSAPSATGSIALLQEHFRNQFSRWMRSATVKAVIAHTADEAGNAEGPDYVSGWGLMNTYKAAELITRSSAIGDTILETALKDEESYELTVFAEENQALTATIAWADPAGTPLTIDENYTINQRDKALINDLDIRLIHVDSGREYQPYRLDPNQPTNAAQKGDNSVDNIEKIYIANPQAGEYLVRVSHKDALWFGFDQQYTLAISGMKTFTQACEITAGFFLANQRTTICTGEEASFINTSDINVGGEAVSYEWTVNGLSVSTDENLNYTFPSDGDYEITLTVSSAKCSDSFTAHASATTLDAGFTYSATGLVVSFNANIFDPTNTTYFWDFGDGSTGTESVRIKLYSEPGTYEVCLTVTQECPATTCQTLELDRVTCPELISETVNNATCGQNNGSINLEVNSTEGNVVYDWSHGPTTAEVTNLRPGTYTVNISDDSNCSPIVKDYEILSSDPFEIDVQGVATSCGEANGTVSVIIPEDVNIADITWSIPSPKNATTITDLPFGNYSVTVTDANGCTESGSFDVAPSKTLAINVTSEAASCGQVNGSATVALINNEEILEIIWFRLEGNDTIILETKTPDLANLTQGTYGVQVISTDLCVAENIFNIEFEDAIEFELNKQDANCGQEDGNIEVLVLNTIEAQSFQWTTGGDQSSINGLKAGNYCVTVTDINNCEVSKCINIEDSNVPNINLTTTKTNCNDNTGSLTVVQEGQEAIIKYKWSTGAETTSPVLDDLGEGNYSVTVTTQDGCETSASAEVVTVDAPAFNVSRTPAACGESNGTAQIFIAGDLADYTINWFNQSTSNAIEGLAAGNYSVIVTEIATGCSNTRSFSIETANADQPNYEVKQESTTCNESNGVGEIAYISGENIDKVVWEDGYIGHKRTGLDAGFYTVDVFYGINCSFSASIFIGRSEVIEFDIVTTPSSCNSNTGSARVVVTNDRSIQDLSWSTGQKIIREISNLSAGNYSVTVEDLDGCIVTKSFHIDATEAPEFSIEKEPATCGEANGKAMITVVDATPESPITYLWSNGTTSSMIEGVRAGEYSVEVTIDEACTIETTVIIEGIELPSITVEKQVADCGEAVGSATVIVEDGNIDDLSIIWEDGTEGPSIINRTAGAYDVTIISDIGCQETLTINIEGSEALLIDMIAEDAQCGQSNGLVKVDILNDDNKELVAYTWDDPNLSTVQQVRDLPPGTYTVTVTDTDGCMAEGTVTVGNVDGPNVEEVSTQPEKCGGSDGAVGIHVKDESVSYTYTWSYPSAEQPTTTNNPALFNIPAGKYMVTITSFEGCQTIVDFEIESTDRPTLDIEITDPSCGENNGTIQIKTANGIPITEVIWEHGETGTRLRDLASGEYTGEVTDINGCTQIVRVSLSGSNSPVISFISEAPVCDEANGSIELLAFGTDSDTYTYKWSNGETSPSIGDLAPGEYTVTVTNEDGCTTIANLELVAKEKANYNVEYQNTTCGLDNGHVIVRHESGASIQAYKWDNGSSRGHIRNLPPGEYAVTITDFNGCTYEESVFIGTSIELNVEAQIIQPTCDGQTGSIELESVEDNLTYQWKHGATTPNITNLIAGDYCVEISSEDGCSFAKCYRIDNSRTFDVELKPTATTCGENNGSVTVKIDTDIPIVSYEWEPAVDNDAYASGLAAGNYRVTVTNASGCSVVTETTVAPSDKLMVDVEVDQHTRCGAPTGSVIVSWEAGIEIAEITVGELSVKKADIEGNSVLVEGLAGGEQTVEVRSSENCTFEKQVTIINTNSAEFSVVPVATTCGYENGMATIRSTNNLRISSVEWTIAPENNPEWQFGGTFGQTVGLLAGEYEVKVTDEYGCEQLLSINIEEETPGIEAEIETTFADCDGTNGMAKVVNTNTNITEYLWSYNGLTTPEATLPEGTHYVWLTNETGCRQRFDFSIGQHNYPSISLNEANRTSCGAANGTASITINSQDPVDKVLLNNEVINWDANETLSLQDLEANIYQLEVFTIHGCSQVKEFHIAESKVFNAYVGTITDASCGNNSGSVLFRSNTSPGDVTFTWTHDDYSSTDFRRGGLAGGDYKVIAANKNGCSEILTFTIETSDQIEFRVNQVVDTECGMENGSISLEKISGADELTYKWSNGQTGTDLSSLNELAAGKYNVTITDDFGCQTNIRDIEVGESEGFDVFTTIKDANCGDGGELKILSWKGSLDKLWLNGERIEQSGATDLAAGTYLFEAISKEGCMISETFDISNTTPLDYDARIENTIRKGETGKIEITMQDYSGRVDYLWSTGETSPSIDNLGAGTYTVTISTTSGCEVVETFTIKVKAKNDSGDEVPTWNPNSNGDLGDIFGNNDEEENEGDNPTDNEVIGEVIDNPSGSNPLNPVITTPEPDPVVNCEKFFAKMTPEVGATVCGEDNGLAGFLFEEFNDHSTSFKWSNGATTPSIFNLTVGQYSVTVTNPQSCQEVFDFEVTANEVPTVDLGAEKVVILPGETSITLDAGKGQAFVSYEWSDGTTSTTLEVTEEGTYQVTAITKDGCISQDEVTVYVLEELYPIELYPNPTTDQITLANLREKVDITVTSLAGNLMTSFSAETATTIDVSSFPIGIYIVQVKTKDGVITQRFVKD